MDAGTPAPLSSFRADPEDLLDFIEELRAAGYRVGLEEHIAAQDLLLALAARGENLEDPERMKGLLGPLLCNTPQEQSDFGPRFDRWQRREVSPPPLPTPLNKHEEIAARWHRDLSGLDRWSLGLLRWGAFAAVLVTLLIAVFLGVSGKSPGDLVSVPGNSGEEVLWTASNLLLGLAIVGLAVWLAWWWRVHRFLRRRVSSGPEEVAHLAVGSLRHGLFPRLLVARVAQDFRRRREIPSRDLNIEATLERTVRRGGWLTPVYGFRQVTPEYLVLIDRAGPDDQQARLFDDLLDRLEEQGVFLTRYFFDRDSRTCFPRRAPASPVTLHDLTALHSSHRLLVFSDGAGLFTPLRAELEPWTDLLASWEHRVLLTPELQEHWGFREAFLSELLTVLPATLEGLSGVIRSIERGSAAKRVEGPESPLFPDDLRSWPLRWTDRSAPEPSRVEMVLAELQRFLGNEGYHWLSACAIYPAMDWDLTLHLGSALQDKADARLLTPEQLGRLVRTPWFRHGYMPDWLRILLISQLPRKLQREIRLAIQAWLLSTREGTDGGSVLEVARQHRYSFNALAQHAIRRLARREPADSPLRDRVFLTFLAGHGSLAVRLPASLRPVLRKSVPPEGVEERPGNPWERRHEIGFWRGFFWAWRMFAFSPVRAFSQTRQIGGLGGPLLFAVLVWIASVVVVFPFNFLRPDINFFIHDARSSLLISFTGMLFSGPVGLLMNVFIGGLVLHGILWVSNRFRFLKAGLPGTYRTLCYASVAQYLVFPYLAFMGCVVSLIIFVWWLILCIVGLAKMHDLSPLRVAIAVLSPILLVVLLSFPRYFIRFLGL